MIYASRNAGSQADEEALALGVAVTDFPCELDHGHLSAKKACNRP